MDARYFVALATRNLHAEDAEQEEALQRALSWTQCTPMRL